MEAQTWYFKDFSVREAYLVDIFLIEALDDEKATDLVRLRKVCSVDKCEVGQGRQYF